MASNTLAGIIRGPVTAIDADAGIEDALRVMGELRISCLLVTSGGAPCGIVTEKDLVRGYSGVANHQTRRVSDIMTPAPLTAPATIGHLEAYRLMSERRIRHLPVTGPDGAIVGIVTESDYVRSLSIDYYIRLKDVASVMAPVTLVAPDMPLGRALELLGGRDVSCVVIADANNTLGILTERDVVRLLREGVAPDTTPVAAVMTTPVVSVPRDSTLLDVSAMLTRERIRRVVVVDGDRPVGILSQHEIVKGLENEYIGHLEGVIADKSRALAELNETRQSLEDQSKVLQKTLDELSVAHAELRAFTKVAAHDLQEPLRSIIIHSQLLERDLGDTCGDDARGYLGEVVDGAHLVRQRVHDLIGYSTAIGAASCLENVDVGDVAQGVLAMLRRGVEETGATFELGALPKVRATRSAVLEIFHCVLGNAIKFRKLGQSPHIHVEAVEEERAWRFTVADDGIGIEPQYFEQIFGLFQRLHTIDAYPGSGAGLAICRRLVEQLGGRIWVESEVGHGSRFHFTLPKTSDQSPLGMEAVPAGLATASLSP